MSAPLRIQRRRTRGYRMPPNTVSVTRPGLFGNSVRIGPDEGEARTAAQAVVMFRYQVETSPGFQASIRARLRGKNLACFCRLCPKHEAAGGKPFGEECADCAPCHADPLGQIANAPPFAGCP